MPGTEASLNRRWVALAPLLADPAAAAVLCDLDGTLAPIVARPELVEVPDRARRALGRIAERYALCAVITGRRPEVARELVGLDGIAYAGNHGLELLEPGAERAVPGPALAGHAGDAAAFAAGLDLGELERNGVRYEDKGPIVALHWRGAEREADAEAAVSRIAAAARAAGLLTHAGRKVLELRPAVRFDKGVAIEALIGASTASRALYAGDDRTDLDGFAALVSMREDGRLDDVVRVGVRSPEGPNEIVTSADVVVDGTDELVDVLQVLAG